MEPARAWTARAVCLLLGLVFTSEAAVRATEMPPGPDNAALLYYQAYLLLPEPTMSQLEARHEVLEGAPPDETVRSYLERAGDALDLLAEGTQRTSCQWGIPYSHGYFVQAPHLLMIRELAFWLEAKARTLAADENHSSALDQCVTLRRFASHVADDVPIMYPVALAVDGVGLQAIQDILGRTPLEATIVSSLQRHFATLRGVPRSPARAVETQLEVLWPMVAGDDETIASMRESLARVSEGEGDSVVVDMEDREVMEIFRKPFEDFLDRALPIMDSDRPYTETYPEIHGIVLTLEKELEADPATLGLSVWADNALNLYSVQVRHKARLRAMMAALEIYRIAAETKKLPDTLPSHAPLDPYSAEPFEYEITANGFLLRCQAGRIDGRVLVPGCWPEEEAEDCPDEVIYEYRFEVTW